MSSLDPTLESERNSDSRSIDDNDFLEFQVDRVGHPRRRLRLRGQSYTFGSGEDCSVRLDDPSLRKMHAILIRQEDRLLLRGYGIAILVNQIRVTEAWLEEQDSFQLGDYTLTLVKGPTGENAFAKPQSTPEDHARPDASPGDPAAIFERFASSAFSSWENNAQSPYRSSGGSHAKCRLSFADGMRLVSQSPSQIKSEAGFDRRPTPTPAYQPIVDRRAKADRRAKSRRKQSTDHSERQQFRQMQRMQEESLQRSEAALKTSVQSTHAIEQLADKLDSLFVQLNDISEHRESDAYGQLHERVSVLETAVDKATKEARLYREKHEQAVTRIGQLEDQLAEAMETHSEQQATWEQEAKSLRSAIEELTQQLEAAQTELKNQEETSGSLHEQLETAQAAADENLRKIQESETRHAQEIETLSAQYAEQETASTEKIEQLQKELSEAVANHNGRQQAWESEAQDLNTTIERLSLQLAESEEQLSQQREQADQLRGDLQEASKSISETQDENINHANELNDELQRAQERFVALQESQTKRLEQWQQEREDLEFKIANQASELAEISALRAASDPRALDDSEVADRLAERLQAEVDRLHQEHIDINFDDAGQPPAESQPSSTTDYPVAIDPSETEFQTGENGATESSIEDAGSPDDDAPTFANPDSMSESLGSSADLMSEDAQQIGEPVGFADMGQACDATLDYSPEMEVDEPAETIQFTEPEETNWASDLPVDDGDAVDHVMAMTSPENDSESESVFQSMTSPNDQSDYREQVTIDSADEQVTDDPSNFDVANTIALDEFQQSDFDDSTAGYAEDFDIDPTAASDQEELADNALSGYTEADWGVDDDDESTLDSAADEEGQDAIGGLAAELIGEFDEEAPQADSFAELPESSAYDHDATNDENIEESTGLMDHGDDPNESVMASELAGYADEDSGHYESELDPEHDESSTSEAHYGGYDDDPQTGLTDGEEVTEEPESYYGCDVDDAEENHSYDDANDASHEPEPEPELEREPEPEPEPVPSASSAETVPVGDDDSIESYMNRLLQRMQDGDEPTEPVVEEASEPAAPVTTLETADIEPQEEQETAQSDVMHESEYLPRRSAPEKSSNMEAMRELANSSARQAIAKSVRNRQRSKAMGNLIFSGIFIVGGGIFAVLAQRQLFPHVLASAACVVLAVYWGLCGLKLLKPPAVEHPEASAPEPSQQNETADS